MLDTFKTIAGCTNDTLAQYYIDKAKQVIKDYTKRNTQTVESYLKNYVIELAVNYYNQRGAEGLKSQSYSGASETYLTDMPETMRKALVAYRRFTQEEEEVSE